MSNRRDGDGSILDPELTSTEMPAGIDRRAFMMRSALIGAVAVLSGSVPATAKETAARAASATAPKVPLSPELEVVKKSKGPVMTVVDEFYKVGPGPSSSHTIGRVDFDTTVDAMALTAREMNTKYKETSEGGLAVSVTLY